MKQFSRKMKLGTIGTSALLGLGVSAAMMIPSASAEDSTLPVPTTTASVVATIPAIPSLPAVDSDLEIDDDLDLEIDDDSDVEIDDDSDLITIDVEIDD